MKKDRNLFEMFNLLNGTDIKEPKIKITRRLIEAIEKNDFTIDKNNDPSVKRISIDNDIREDIDLTFEDKGGIIVFSTDVNAIKMNDNVLKNFIYQKLTSLANYINKNKKVTDLLAKNKNLHGMGYSVGNFVKGRYISKDGQTFSEKSTSVEIIGIESDVLIKIAENICSEFRQESVLVKNYATNSICIVTA